jgi:hypothetical protein
MLRSKRGVAKRSRAAIGGAEQMRSPCRNRAILTADDDERRLFARVDGIR